jgi:MFS family permease
MFIGQALSFIGYQFTAVAVPVQMFAMTRSSFWVGLIGFAGLVPLLGFALWGGAVIDARDRRRVLLTSSWVTWSATLVLLAQAVLGLREPWLLIALTAVQAAAFAVSSPARSAIVPHLVPTEEVASANTLNFTATNLAAVIGPLSAGLVLARYSVAVAFAVDAALFTIAMWATLRLPPQPPALASGGSRWADFVAGMRYLRQTPVVLLTFAIDVVAMALALPRALFPEVAAERFGGGTAVGWLYSAIAIGSVAAGLASGWVSRVRRQGVAIVAAVVVWGLAVAAAGLAPWLWLAVACLAIGGAADLISAVYRQTVLLTYAPDEMRGRLQGAFMAVVAGGPRLGDLRVGAMAAVTGATVAWTAGGMAAAVVAVLLAVGFPALVGYTTDELRR